jgi:hypothetical protein
MEAREAGNEQLEMSNEQWEDVKRTSLTKAVKAVQGDSETFFHCSLLTANC